MLPHACVWGGFRGGGISRGVGVIFEQFIDTADIHEHFGFPPSAPRLGRPNQRPWYAAVFRRLGIDL